MAAKFDKHKIIVVDLR